MFVLSILPGTNCRFNKARDRTVSLALVVLLKRRMHMITWSLQLAHDWLQQICQVWMGVKESVAGITFIVQAEHCNYEKPCINLKGVVSLLQSVVFPIAVLLLPWNLPFCLRIGYANADYASVLKFTIFTRYQGSLI